jgi:glucose-1-phosphate thymidylyltransferase
MKTKGIILAGGTGSRLYPLSKVYSKQLIAVYDKPMIYYPLTTLILSGIQDILIISDIVTLSFYKKLFGDGSVLGLHFEYALQEKPNGIAEAFIIGENFIGDDNVALILGDNIFFGCEDIFRNAVLDANENDNFVGTIFALNVSQPQRYGVVQFSKVGVPTNIIEKPTLYISNYVVPGFYTYNSSVVKIAHSLKPSGRGELEITDINNQLLQNNQFNVITLFNGVTWLDCGTSNSLLDAGNFVASIEQRHGIKIGCYEEAAYKMGFIDSETYTEYINSLPICAYKEFLLSTTKNNYLQLPLFSNKKI